MSVACIRSSTAPGLNNALVSFQEVNMATSAQRSAARRNIKKAAAAAGRKRTIAHLPKSTRTALGKKGASARKKR
jgi:hypothetical protein